MESLFFECEKYLKSIGFEKGQGEFHSLKIPDIGDYTVLLFESGGNMWLSSTYNTKNSDVDSVDYWSVRIDNVDNLKFCIDHSSTAHRYRTLILDVAKHEMSNPIVSL